MSVLSREIDVGLVDTVILGDSSATFGLVPGIIESSVNLSLVASSPVEALIVLERYIKEYGQPKRVILSFSFNTVYYEKKFLDVYAMAGFYKFGELFSMKHGLLKELNFFERQSRRLVLLKKYLFFKIRTVVILLRIKRKIIRRTIRKFFRSTKNTNLKRKKRINTHNVFIRQRGYSNNGLVVNDVSSSFLFKQFLVPEYYLKGYENLLKYCVSKGVGVLSVIVPIREGDVPEEGGSFYRGQKKYFKKLQATYPKFNFADDLRIYPIELMAGESHVNGKGAIRFSGEVADLVSEIAL